MGKGEEQDDKRYCHFLNVDDVTKFCIWKISFKGCQIKLTLMSVLAGTYLVNTCIWRQKEWLCNSCSHNIVDQTLEIKFVVTPWLQIHAITTILTEWSSFCVVLDKIRMQKFWLFRASDIISECFSSLVKSHFPIYPSYFVLTIWPTNVVIYTMDRASFTPRIDVGDGQGVPSPRAGAREAVMNSILLLKLPCLLSHITHWGAFRSAETIQCPRLCAHYAGCGESGSSALPSHTLCE